MIDSSKISTRCRISHRAPFRSKEPIFYKCAHCNNLMIQASPELESVVIFCCEKQMTELKPISTDEAPEDELHQIEYLISGGFEQNAIKVHIGRSSHPMDEEHHIQWIYLYTFQGGQLKYLAKRKPPEAIFALAEEDAFSYCDRQPCEMGRGDCQFKCKRGWVLYAYCNVHGLQMRRL